MTTKGPRVQQKAAVRTCPGALRASLRSKSNIRPRTVTVRAAEATPAAPAPEVADAATSVVLRQVSSLPVVEGLPYFGMLIHTMGPKGFDYDALLEEHNTDALVLNFGAVLGRCLFISVPQDVIQVLLEQGEALQQTLPDNTRAILMPTDRALSDIEAKPWRMTMAKVLTHSLVMNTQVPLMVAQFTETISRLCRSGEETLWRRDARSMVFNVACGAVMGDLLSREDLEYLFPVACANTDAQFALNYGLRDGLPFTRFWRGMRAKHEAEAFLTDKLHQELKDRERLQAKGGMLNRLMEAMQEEGVPTEGDSWEVSKTLAAEIRFLLFSGTDTTAYTATRLLQRLAKHPQWLDTLWEEQERLMAVYGEDIDRRVISRSAVALAVFQEIMRLEGAAPVLFRDAQRDTVIGNIEVPAGTRVCLSVGSVTKKTGNGGNDFDPDQWLSEGRTQVQTNNAPGNLSFGAGSRRCVGRHLAMVQIVTMIVVVARHVRRVEMSPEERDRTFYSIGHPTDMPLRLIAR